MKTLCYSVRVDNIVRISPKAYKVTAFDGSSDIIPSSQVMGPDCDVDKCEAYWISAWILEKKHLQYSTKKSAWFENGKMTPTYTVSRHEPERVKGIESNIINELKR